MTDSPDDQRCEDGQNGRGDLQSDDGRDGAAGGAGPSLQGSDLLLEENTIIRERLAAVLDAVSEGLVCIDERHVAHEINRSARELFLSGDVPQSQIPFGRLWPTAPEKVLQAIDVAIKAQRPVPEFLVTGQAPPLLGKSLLIQVLPLTLPSLRTGTRRRELGALICLRDVTRIKHLESALRERHHYHGFIGRSAPMRTLYENLKLVAHSDATVMLIGESGTGKELAAAAIHYEGPRAGKPFLKINCSALPESLIESELFGHVRGAFTGAIATHKGLFDAANGGTLFLDEIGEISPRLQLSLLRVIETKTFEQVGATRPNTVDVRLITATNADLRQKVREGQFREDLYYRLNVVTIELPPLRRRIGDIRLLTDTFLARLGERIEHPLPRMAPETYQALEACPWPGNVRQLENALEQAVILCRDETLEPHHLPRDLFPHATDPTSAHPGAEATTPSAPPGPGGGHRRRLDRETLRATLEACGWNQVRAAEALGVHRSTIWRRMKQWGLDT